MAMDFWMEAAAAAAEPSLFPRARAPGAADERRRMVPVGPVMTCAAKETRGSREYRTRFAGGRFAILASSSMMFQCDGGRCCWSGVGGKFCVLDIFYTMKDTSPYLVTIS